MATFLLRNISKTRFHLNRTSPLYTILCESNPINYPNTTVTYPRLCSTKNPQQKPTVIEKSHSHSSATLQQKLKKTIAQYGTTVIVFHVSISLVSLGACYLLVSSGLDVNKLILSIGFSGEIATKIATNAGTFAVAYAVHKVFAPVRIMITLTATPFIVRYLRQIGILKKSI